MRSFSLIWFYFTDLGFKIQDPGFKIQDLCPSGEQDTAFAQHLSVYRRAGNFGEHLERFVKSST
jgi:hypothetical protein